MSGTTDSINSMVDQKAQELKDQEAARQQQQNSGGENGGEQQETPEEKAAREKQEAEQQQQQNNGEGAGGEEGKDKGDAGAKTKEQETSSNEQIDSLLKKFNVSSVEELEKVLEEKNKPELSPEQKKKEEEKYQANLISYSVDNDLMSIEDFNRLQEVKGMEDEDLVFAEFVKDMREELSEVEEGEDELTEEEIFAKIKEAFDKEYPLNSKNQKTKNRAENKIAKAAKEIRSPLESSFNSAKEKYDDEQGVRRVYPEYQKRVTDILSKAVPEKIKFFSTKDNDEDVSIDIDVSEEVKKEIIESLTDSVVKNNINTFSLFRQGKIEEIEREVAERSEFLLWKKMSEEGKQKIAEKFLGRGKKQGSNTGAEESFATNQAGSGAAAAAKKDPKQEVIDGTRKK